MAIFDIKNKQMNMHAVYVDGRLAKNAIYADDEEGYALVEVISEPYWGYVEREKIEKIYGKIHITIMEGYEYNYFREPSLIKKFHS